MSDRKLLELAAKAVGLPAWGWMGPAFIYVKDNTFTDWSPLEDDGDALRLAVNLNLLIQFNTRHVFVFDSCGNQLAFLGKKDKPFAATRRAIVRAAAALASKGEEK